MTLKSFGLIVGSCLLIVAVLTAAMLSIVPALCSEQDSTCIRDWFSSIGSWVGSVATIATLSFLVDQHRQLLRLQTEPKRLLCENMRSFCSELVDNLLDISAASGTPYNGPPAQRPLSVGKCRSELQQLKTLLAYPINEEFSRTISDTSRERNKARDSLENGVKALEKFEAKAHAAITDSDHIDVFVAVSEAAYTASNYHWAAQEKIRNYLKSTI